MPAKRLAALALASLTLLAGCGGSGSSQPAPVSAPAPASQPAAPAAKNLTKVDFLLDGPLTGYYAPFFEAIDKGYYKDAGLDVTITEGKGSVNTVEQVGHGNYPLGFADVTAEAAAVSQGVAIKAVAVYFQSSPQSLVFKTSKGIKSPADLAGKTVALSPGSAGAKLFPAFLAINHVDASKVKTVDTASIPAMNAAVAQDKADAALIIGIYAVPILKAQGVDAGQLLLGDYGLPMLSNGIVVGDDYLKAHADVVKAFIAATTKGWQDAQKDPDAAAAAEQKLAPAAGMKVPQGAADMLKLALPLLTSKDSQGHPLGWMPPAAWTQTLDTLHKYEGLEKVLPADSYYTNQLVGQ